MADIKTTLRELSVATTIGLLSSNIEFQQQDLYDSQRFFSKFISIVNYFAEFTSECAGSCQSTGIGNICGDRILCIGKKTLRII